MKSKSVIILLAAAAAVGIVALLLNRGDGSAESTSSAIPTSFFPDLTAKVNDVTTIDVKRPGESFSIQRSADGWGLASKSGFPVQLEQVKGAVVGIAQLKPVEPKTSNPDLYSKIGVQDPGEKPIAETPPTNPEEAAPTQPTLVTLKDDKGAVLASLIIGTQKYGNTPSIFVRKAGEKQSWLAEGRLEVPTDPMQWIERQVLNIPRERIESVSIINLADGTELEASRDNASSSFTVKNMPPGRELTAPTAPETLVTGVQYLSVDDVAPIDQVGFANPTNIAVYHTFDGLVITARTVKKDNKDWVNLAFSFEAPPASPTEPPKEPVTPEAKPPVPPKPAQKSADEVKKEVEDLTAKLSKWAFAVPDYKAKNFTATMDSLLKPLAAPSPAAPSPNGPPIPQPPNPNGG